MHIERLTPADGPRLRAIRLHALAEAPDAFGSTLAETAARPEADWPAAITALPTFVAVIGEQDVGMVRGAPDPDDDGLAWLISMWVAPQARRAGVGAALAQAVIDWARAAGFSRLRLDVADHNTGAVALYEALGFAPTGAVGALPPPRSHITEHTRERTL